MATLPGTFYENYTSPSDVGFLVANTPAGVIFEKEVFGSGKGGKKDTIFYADDGDKVKGGKGYDAVVESEGAALKLSKSVESGTLTGNSEGWIKGNGGNNNLVGSDGNNTLEGNGGKDVIAGNAGDDGLLGGKGKDILSGGAGDDLLKGGKGNDKLWGGDGSDILKGGKSSDKLFGLAGDDQLFGQDGKDSLLGASGMIPFLVAPALIDSPATQAPTSLGS